MSTFNFETFTNLMKQSPKKAFAYRDKNTKIVWKKEIIEKSFKSEDFKTELDNITRQELKDLVKDAWIDFYANIKTEKLKEIVLDNNLL